MKKIVFTFIIIGLCTIGWFWLRQTQVRSGDENNASVGFQQTKMVTGLVANQSPSHRKEKPSRLKQIEKADVIVEDQKINKALANIQKKSRRPTSQKNPLPENLRTNSLFEGTSWQLWSNVRAVVGPATDPNEPAVANISRYSVIESNDHAVDFTVFDKTSLPVVFDTRMKRTGIVTGMLKVVTDRKDKLETAIGGLGAYITNSFDPIDTFFVTSEQSVFDLQLLYTTLKAQPFVQSIEIDILDRNYEKK